MGVCRPALVVPLPTMREHQLATRHLDPRAAAEERLSAQQLFERELALESGHDGGSLRSLARALATMGGSQRRAAPTATPTPAPRHLEGLAQLGCVTLHGLRTPAGRRTVDHLVVAPSGLYVIEDRPWRGQVADSGDWLYVDGRPRSGVPEAVRRTAEAVQSALDSELDALGLAVTPVLCLPAADESWRSIAVQGVAVFTGRGLPRHLRHAPEIMGRDTVVRLGLAADRLLEKAIRVEPS